MNVNGNITPQAKCQRVYLIYHHRRPHKRAKVEHKVSELLLSLISISKSQKDDANPDEISA